MIGPTRGLPLAWRQASLLTVLMTMIAAAASAAAASAAAAAPPMPTDRRPHATAQPQTPPRSLTAHRFQTTPRAHAAAHPHPTPQSHAPAPAPTPPQPQAVPQLPSTTQTRPEAATPGPAPAPEDVAAIRALLAAYYDAYGRADLPAMLALWHPSAGGLKGLQRHLADEFERRRFAFTDLTVSVSKADVSGGLARVTVDVAITTLTGGAATRERRFRNVSCLRQDTAWRLWLDESASADLASRVARAQSDEARDTLMRDEPDLVNSEFVEALSLDGGRSISAGRPERAADLLDLAERLARDGGHRPELARTLLRQGTLATARQQWDDAFRRYDEARAAFEALDNPREATLSGLQMAHARYSGRHYVEALTHYEVTLDRMSAGAGSAGSSPPAFDATSRSGALQGLANTHYVLGDLTRALDAYQRALAVHEQARAAWGVASTLEAIGRVRRDQGEYQAALDAYGRALNTARTSGQRAGEVTAIKGLAEVYRLQGQYDRAVEEARRGLAVAQSIDDAAGAAELAFEIGLSLASERRWPDAQAAYQRALALEEQAGSRERVARALAAVGTVLAAQSRHDAALERYRASLAIREQLDDQPRVAWTLVHIGMTLEQKALHDEALAALHRALLIFEQQAEVGAMGIVQAVVADVHVARDDPDRALEHAARARDHATASGDLDTLAHARLAAGRAHRLAGSTSDALTALQEAVTALDDLDRQSVDVPPEVFFGETVAPFHALADLFVAEHRAADALAASERARLRLLRAITGRVGTRVVRGLSEAERDEERRLAHEVVSLTNQLTKERGRQAPDADRLARLDAEASTVSSRLDALRADLYARLPRLAIARGRAALPDLATIRAATLDRGWSAVSFVLSERRLLAIVLTPDAAEPTAVAIEVAPADLASRLLAYRDMLMSRNDGLPAEARALHDLLWSPVAEHLGGATHIVIVPDGVLWSLPFETLIDTGGRFLVESATLAYAPSLAALVWRASDRDPARPSEEPAPLPAEAGVLALGNPALGPGARDRFLAARPNRQSVAMPEAEREARLVAEASGSTRAAAAVGSGATLAVLEDRARAGAALHVAAPAVLSDASPMFSELLLAAGPVPTSPAPTVYPSRGGTGRQAAATGDAPGGRSAGGTPRTQAAPVGRAGPTTAAAANPRPGQEGLSPSDDSGIVPVADVAAWTISRSPCVLSRAEPASPGATTGEAFVGLSWALDVAGCATQIISRWSAESVATPGLMAEFHRLLRTAPKAASSGRDEKRLGVVDALRRAQLTVLNNPARREPWFWGGFLVMGVANR